jgi:hypothetical protein
MADTPTRVGVTDAVGAAMQFVNDLDEDQQLHDRLLEEIEMDRDGSGWPSIWVPSQHPDPMSWIQNA